MQYLPMNLFSEPKLAIINCLSAERAVASKWPFIIGGGDACDLAIDGTGSQCEIAPAGRGYAFNALSGDGAILLSGADTKTSVLKKDANYSLMVGDQLFVFRLTKDPDKWFDTVAIGRWMLHHQPTKSTSGPYAVSRLAGYLPDAALDGKFETLAFLQGANIGFFVESIRYIFDGLSDEASSSRQEEPVAVKAPQEDEEVLAGDAGSLTCPTCWLKFDPGDVKHVAVHDKMKGDPLLGPAEMKRFRATRYNDNGVALDPMGIPTMDIACPHCHRRLPPDFLDVKHHIVSIVGAPTSGKSYFLCVFTQMLKKTLIKHYNTAFVDADPTSNIALTTMRDTLFGSATPEQAKVAKTDLEGDMYERLTRHGRKVMLPKPFIFNVQPQNNGRATKALIFYDNAGEHFQPGIDQTESPGTLHLAASSGIIFLFDPTYNKEFRARLSQHHDPQLKISGHADIQDTILAEAKVRVKKVLGLDAATKLDRPLAVVVGKLDVWSELLPSNSLAQAVNGGEFDQAAVDENSRVVRQLMLEVCPQVVASAEAISNNVRYFPVSAFGCSPEIIGYGKDPKSGNEIPILSPNPAKISPILVEIPILWILSQVERELIPSRT
jgi:hypothetical protein